MSKTEQPSAWDFVQKYYPDYDHADEILEANTISCLFEGEADPGSGAEELLNEDYDGNIENERIKHDYNEIHVNIYESAMVAFLENKVENAKKILQEAGYITSSLRHEDEIVAVAKEMGITLTPHQIGVVVRELDACDSDDAFDAENIKHFINQSLEYK